jgi:glutamate-1-semialdehyde 2,1-aminomutase
LSAFGGRHEIMRHLMPEGDCQHSGTYNGHVVPVAAGLAAVRAYRRPGFYDHIHALAGKLYTGLAELFQRHSIAARLQGLGARFGIYFGITHEVRDWRDTLAHDRAKMLQFIAAAIDEGVYFHDYGGAACHHGFCSAMTVADVDEALARLDRALTRVAHEA